MPKKRTARWREAARERARRQDSKRQASAGRGLRGQRSASPYSQRVGDLAVQREQVSRNPQLRQMLGLIFDRLERYERGGPADLVLDDEVNEAIAAVATTWRAMDAEGDNRELAARVWHSLATLHAYRSLLIPEPRRGESRALATHYFLRAGTQGAPHQLLRKRLARAGQDDWLEHIGDGRDHYRLLFCVHSRILQTVADQVPDAVCGPEVDALVVGLMEALLAESPATDADPPEPAEEIWVRLGRLHEARGYSAYPDLIDRALADYYLLQLVGLPIQLPEYFLESVRESLREDPGLLGPEGWYRMARGLFHLYAQTGNLEALYGALHLLRRTAAAATAAEVDASELNFLLSQAWLGRFERGGRPEHLDRGIECAEAAYHALGPAQPWYGEAADLLSRALRIRFLLTGARADIDQAIAIARDAAAASHDRQASLTLADLLLCRHKSASDQESVAEAQRVLRAALTDLPAEDALRPSLLNELGMALGMQHALDNSDTDALDEAVSLFEQARDMVPADDPRRLIYHGNISNALASKTGPGEVLLAEALAYFQHFEASGDTGALELARNRLQRAIDTAGPDDPLGPRYLHALCFVLWRLAQRRNEPGIMRQAVDAGRRAVAALAPEDSGFPAALSDLGTALRHLSVMLDEPSLFDEGLDCARRAAASIPADDPDPGASLTNLGNALRQRATETGDMRLLDEAIGQQRAAVDVTPEGHPERHIYLSNLGACFMVKYQWLLDSTALFQAIDAFTGAEQAVPVNDHRKARYRANIGRLLSMAAHDTGRPQLLSASLEALTDAVEATQHDHPDRSLRLADLAGVHREIASARGEPPGPEAYRRAREALTAARAGSPHRAICLCELSRTLLDGYDHTADVLALSEAVRRARQAVAEAQSLDIRAQARLLLTSALGRLYENSGQRPDLRTEIQDQLRSIVTAPGPTDDRISAARRWAGLCTEQRDWEGVLQAVQAALDLVPILVSRRLGRHDQHAAAAHLQGLASVGAAAALSLDRPERAVELLEAGRGAVLARALESRMDLHALRAHAPALADAYLRLARELDTVAYGIAVTGGGESTSDRREQAAAEPIRCWRRSVSCRASPASWRPFRTSS